MSGPKKAKAPTQPAETLSGDLLAALEAAQMRQRAAAGATVSFRDFLFSPDYCANYMLATGVSAAVEAVALASEGLPIPPALFSDAEVQEVFRCDRGALVGIKPTIVAIGAGRRGGKSSNLIATKCVHAAWTVPIPMLKPGEIARAVVIAPDLDQSTAVFNFCKGIVESSPVLRAAIVKLTTEEIVLRRPDGKLVEIVVGAASAGGKAARSRSLVFAAMDEACFFYPSGSHVANDRDIYVAALGTIKFLDQAQLWLSSTPWIAEIGVLEEIIKESWGKPGFALVAARISSYRLRGNSDDDSLREGLDDATYSREILAIPFAAGSFGFFSMEKVIAAEDRDFSHLAPITIGAGADLGFLNDSSALAVARQLAGSLFSVSHVEELRPRVGEPLKPTIVCNQFAETLARFEVASVASDVHEKATAIEIFGNSKIRVIDAPTQKDDREETFRAVKALFDEDRLSLAELAPDVREYLRGQLRMIVATPRPGGGFDIRAPKRASRQTTASKGLVISGHADAVSALVLALWRAGAGRPGTRGKEKGAKKIAQAQRAKRLPSRRDAYRGSEATGGYFGGGRLAR